MDIQALKNVVEDHFDGDLDRSAKLDVQSLFLLIACQRILDAHNGGLHVGRDEATELAVRMRGVGMTIGLLEDDSGKAADAFHESLSARKDRHE